MKIAHGITRTVLLTQRLAFKVPCLRSWQRFLWGLLANMQEAQWSGYDDRLCPVLSALPGGWLAIMPRAIPLTALPDMDVTGLPVESKPDSFGRLPDGRIVVIDYGGPAREGAE